MKYYRIYFILFCNILLLYSCDMQRKNERKNYRTCKRVASPEYNPQKAGATIISKIDVPAGYFIGYTNHHYYQIGYDQIIIFDLSADNINVIKSVPFDVDNIYSQDDIVFRHHCTGIMQSDNRIYFIMKKSINTTGVILSVNDDGDDLHKDGMPFDMQSFYPVDTFYLDSSANELYVGYRKTYQNEFIYRYSIKPETQEIEQQNYKCEIYDQFGIHKIYITQNFVCCESNYDDTIVIYRKDKTEKTRTIYTRYLNVNHKVLSVFEDECGNMWLYLTTSHIVKLKFNKKNLM